MQKQPISGGVSNDVKHELSQAAIVLASNLQIHCRVTFSQELKQGLTVYKPSKPAKEFLNDVSVAELACLLPPLTVQLVRLDSLEGL